MKKLIPVLLAALMLCVAWSEQSNTASIKDKSILKYFVNETMLSLELLDITLEKATARSVKPDKESEIRQLLSYTLKDQPSLISASFVDNKGVLLYAEPAEQKKVEGSDISMQEHVKAMLENPSPIFSSVFMAVEGKLAVVISRPLFDYRKRFVGSLNLLVDHEKLIEDFLSKHKLPDGYELLTMQTDGVIVYSSNKTERGKNIFTDPMFAGNESLQTLGREICANPSGNGSFTHSSNPGAASVNKIAIWENLTLHGKEWRAVLIKTR